MMRQISSFSPSVKMHTQNWTQIWPGQELTGLLDSLCSRMLGWPDVLVVVALVAPVYFPGSFSARYKSSVEPNRDRVDE